MKFTRNEIELLNKTLDYFNEIESGYEANKHGSICVYLVDLVGLNEAEEISKKLRDFYYDFNGEMVNYRSYWWPNHDIESRKEFLKQILDNHDKT